MDKKSKDQRMMEMNGHVAKVQKGTKIVLVSFSNLKILEFAITSNSSKPLEVGDSVEIVDYQLSNIIVRLSED